MPRACPVESHAPRYSALGFQPLKTLEFFHLTMKLYNYEPHDLRFAFCYRVYFSWKTHRSQSVLPLRNLARSTLDTLLRPHNVRVLACATNETLLRCVVSLYPTENISACASKLKGRVSRWLSAELQLAHPTFLLSKGYFACTIGKAKSKAVEHYLSLQAEHHGYSKRVLPPVFVDQYPLTPTEEARISPKHAMVIAKFHLVLSTSGRRGILGSQQGKRIATKWRRIQKEHRFQLIKVSFVPDHVHIALRSHPAISPASVAAFLMNAAQEMVQEELIEAGVERLWMTSLYIGSYGDLSSPQICKFIEKWKLD